MYEIIKIKENDLNLVFEITEDQDLRLLHFSALNLKNQLEGNDNKWFRLVEVQLSGENHDDHHGAKHTGTLPAKRLEYQTHKDYRNHQGRKLEFILKDLITCLEVTSHLQFYNDISVISSWVDLENKGEEELGIEYVSSFALTGIAKEGLQSWSNKMKLYIPHHTWQGEAQWKDYSLRELGLYPVSNFSMKRISISNTGTWSAKEFAPMGMLENIEAGTNFFWQIEHNGSWQWEISDIDRNLYLQLSGPTEQEHQWWKKLKPQESFTTVPVAIGSVKGDFNDAIGELTSYRRAIRRPNKDNEELPVIFNDYMNCLFGEPTTEKLLPLIDAAEEAACEYFCIDAGWYDDGYWWDGVGEWLPSKERFTQGIEEPLNYIKAKGMVSGLWLELEVMGINCQLADQVPDDWFFCRHGKRVIDHGRYQLDFRNPEVINHANQVVERLIEDYGVGYIKMDYNIDAGAGTELNADSFGDGLLEHNRAYLAWVDSIFARYPDLVIENCSSGGMRMDYALLKSHSIQSSSDQTDYRKNAVIAAAAPSLVTPEQCAVWSYPLTDGDQEEVIFNMVNAILMRIHQSGHLAEIDQERKALVKEGINYYKGIREDIKNSLPFWPLGLPSFDDQWISLGLKTAKKTYVAVWRLNSQVNTCRLPIRHLKGMEVKVRMTYPLEVEGEGYWNQSSGILTVSLPQNNTARIFELVKMD
ncbi:alpha-galactosidase [Orenia metallireducens]|uniref:Alpha-galactosidase n=1 Tax=Orenia metallireducens TaxID=1413210 RepID=A0A285IFW2_9FIRM|nr:alpha-galactosidase [Orenia metallireducens]PRX18166.1 alpha-galactosidase [Orenia metallireducens]SNY46813.1 alpha-galactosidase [Orenia metallireducens]